MLKIDNTFEIDDITYSDLGIADIYKKYNKCKSSAGNEYFLYKLKNPFAKKCIEYDEFSALKDEVFTLDEDKVRILTQLLSSLSYIRGYSFSEKIDEFKDSERESNRSHIIVDILLIASFALIFVWPGPALVAFFLLVAYSVSEYFKKKNIIAAKLSVFSYLIKLLKAVTSSDFTKLYNLIDKAKYPKIKALLDEQKSIYNKFKGFMSFTFLISEGARTNSNPFSIVLDYVRIIFHVDIIKYNTMTKFIKENMDDAVRLFSNYGELDVLLNLRHEFQDFELCKPNFATDVTGLKAEEVYHPLIESPVKNTINTNNNVLITGCNASGKSTFLRTISIAALFAQSFSFTFAKSYEAPFYNIYSSMALKDDLNSSESYFMAEIKSLKRIVDSRSSTGARILCVIDEVLRGTNTVERIAASVEILKGLCKENVLCFTATHDIELTQLLAEEYDNYHFSEEVTDDDVKFNFVLNEGVATSRNAIRLLSVLGYDEKLVENARNRADEFMRTGKWQ